MVDCEKLNRGSTDPSATREQCAPPLEVFGPVILPRMEQSNHLSRVWIDARDVWSLMGVASITAQTKILGVRLPAVLYSNDGVDRESEENVLLLMNAAILAAIASPLTDESPRGGVHQVGWSLRSLRALD